jgi:hypothetical protein
MKTSSILLAFATCAIGSQSAVAITQDDAALAVARSGRDLDGARKCLIKGEYSQAEAIARSVAEDKSLNGRNYVRARLIQAEALIAQNDPKEAFDLLSEVDNYPSDPRERITFTYASFLSGRLYRDPYTSVIYSRENSIKKLIGDRASLPNGETKALYEASLLIARSMYPEQSGDALNDLKAAERLAPGNTALELMWGHYYLDQKKPDLARPHLLAATRSKIAEAAKVAKDLLSAN